MNGPREPWQPDPRKLGNWTSMFEPQAREAPSPPQSPPPVEPPDEAELAGVDLSAYKPCQLQRGRSRPALMLGLRRFDAKSGLWHSWSMAYPSLYAIDVIGDRMVSLDFGTRQFVLEGRGLDELARHIQSGTVLAIEEYSPHIWPQPTDGVVISKIEKIEPPG